MNEEVAGSGLDWGASPHYSPCFGLSALFLGSDYGFSLSCILPSPSFIIERRLGG